MNSSGWCADCSVRKRSNRANRRRCSCCGSSVDVSARGGCSGVNGAASGRKRESSSAKAGGSWYLARGEEPAKYERKRSRKGAYGRALSV